MTMLSVCAATPVTWTWAALLVPALVTDTGLAGWQAGPKYSGPISSVFHGAPPIAILSADPGSSGKCRKTITWEEMNASFDYDGGRSGAALLRA